MSEWGFFVSGSLRASDIGPNVTLHWGGCKVVFGRMLPCIGADVTGAKASKNGATPRLNGEAPRPNGRNEGLKEERARPTGLGEDKKRATRACRKSRRVALSWPGGRRRRGQALRGHGRPGRNSSVGRAALVGRRDIELQALLPVFVSHRVAFAVAAHVVGTLAL